MPPEKSVLNSSLLREVNREKLPIRLNPQPEVSYRRSLKLFLFELMLISPFSTSKLNRNAGSKQLSRAALLAVSSSERKPLQRTWLWVVACGDWEHGNNLSSMHFSKCQSHRTARSAESNSSFRRRKTEFVGRRKVCLSSRDYRRLNPWSLHFRYNSSVFVTEWFRLRVGCSL